MSYHIGQFRSTQIPYEQYITEYIEGTDWRITQGEIGNNKYNYSINLLGDAVLTDANNYYVHFLMHAMERDIHFSVTLKNNASAEDQEQYIGDFVMPGTTSNPSLFGTEFEFVITPNDVYNCIYIETDYIPQEQAETEVLDEVQYAKLFDIIPYLQRTYDADLRALKKIGIQGRPGLLMGINGEEIRIGKSGIYELANEVIITSLNFYPYGAEDYFIVDFEY